MTQQVMFGGNWTQQKLQILSKYLRAYRKIFDRNTRARYFRVSYVDAFAGTGTIPRPELEGTLAGLIPSLMEAEEEFRKGSVRRALEIEPPFHNYIFIEKDRGKCDELLALREEFPDRNIVVVNDDANLALLKWCQQMDTRSERAVVFLDPFGASVEWTVIEAIAGTKAVDLWILFPYGAVNRMLTRDRKPSPSWSDKLTRIFGTPAWEDEFYSSSLITSLLEPDKEVAFVQKTTDQTTTVNFFVKRLNTVFSEIAEPGFLCNSKGLLFVLFFAACNRTGSKIANDLLRDIAR
ncbi:MAG: three-Cys-motif partner protein TcmP [Terracidiphilus sp.]